MNCLTAEELCDVILAEIYPETINVLQKLKKGYTIAALTDLPSAMPDEIFQTGHLRTFGLF